MSTKISSFACQHLTENLPTRTWQCACHVSRSCLHCSQPRSGELKTYVFWLVFRNNHFGVNYQFFKVSDVIVESALNPLLPLHPSPRTRSIMPSYSAWRKLSLNVLRLLFILKLMYSKSFFHKYNFYILLYNWHIPLLLPRDGNFM